MWNARDEACLSGQCIHSTVPILKMAVWLFFFCHVLEAQIPGGEVRRAHNVSANSGCAKATLAVYLHYSNVSPRLAHKTVVHALCCTAPFARKHDTFSVRISFFSGYVTHRSHHESRTEARDGVAAGVCFLLFRCLAGIVLGARRAAVTSTQ